MNGPLKRSSGSIQEDQDEDHGPKDGPKERPKDDGNGNADIPPKSRINQSHNTWDSAKSKIVKLWKKSGLDIPTLLAMMK